MALYSVLGAGNGGQALSAILKHKGNEVRLWARKQSLVEELNRTGRKINLYGAIRANTTIDLVTTNIEEAVKETSIIFIVLPANAHTDMAKSLAPLLKKWQTVILNPGRTAGALEFSSVIRETIPMDEMPLILESQSLFCACRAKIPGEVDILSFKKSNLIGGFPKQRIPSVSDDLSEIYQDLGFAENTLQTGLDNMGAILHPAPVLLNSGWIESRDTFFAHYYQGISPSVSKFLEKMDLERLQIAEKLSVQVRSVKNWHEETYGCVGETLFETLQKNSAYASLDAPRTLVHRYLLEDLPTGLVPISELGRITGVPTPHIDTIISLGSAMLEIDFRSCGRNLSNLGIVGKTVSEVKSIFENGV